MLILRASYPIAVIGYVSSLAFGAVVQNVPGAPASPSRAPSLLLNPTLSESTLNFTTPATIPPTGNPPDPLVVQVAGTSLSLTFSSYTRAIPLPDTLVLLLQISLTINEKVIEARGDGPIGIDTEFHWGHAWMILYAKEEPLTYGQLNAALRAMTRFARIYDSVGYLMEMKDTSRPGMPTVGRARLRYV